MLLCFRRISLGGRAEFYGSIKSIAQQKAHCSTESLKRAEMKYITEARRRNGYPLNLAKNHIKPEKRIGPAPRIGLTLPYITGISEEAEKRLKRELPQQIQIGHRPSPPLKVITDRRKDQLNINKEPGIICFIPCTCGRKYVGQTRRNFDKRKTEHLYDFSTQDSNNLLAEHCVVCGGRPEVTRGKVIDKEKNLKKRLLMESVMIQSLGQEGMTQETGRVISGIWQNYLDCIKRDIMKL